MISFISGNVKFIVEVSGNLGNWRVMLSAMASWGRWLSEDLKGAGREGVKGWRVEIESCWRIEDFYSGRSD